MSEPQNMIPVAFWKTLSDEEWQRIWNNGGKLDRPLCERLYRMTDRHGEVPDSITPLIHRNDVEQMFGKGKRRRGRGMRWR